MQKLNKLIVMQQTCLRTLIIQNHESKNFTFDTGTQMHTVLVGGKGGIGEGKYRTPAPPPQANFKTLVNKNTIKPEIRRPPWQFFLKALTPQGLQQKLQVPPPLDFQPVCIYVPEQYMKTNLSLNTGTLLHAGNQTLCNVESKSLQFQIFVICHPFGSILVLILLMMTYLSDPLLHNLDKINSKNIKPNTTLNL